MKVVVTVHTSEGYVRTLGTTSTRVSCALVVVIIEIVVTAVAAGSGNAAHAGWVSEVVTLAT